MNKVNILIENTNSFQLNILLKYCNFAIVFTII